MEHTENNLSYIQAGDYQIPELKIEETDRPIGKYGRMRRTYLKEHRPVLYSNLSFTQKLFPHLLEIDQAAESRLAQLMPELVKAAGATEELKAKDQMRWVGLMNNCKAQAEEIILKELIYN